MEILVTDLKTAYGLDVIKAKKIIYGLNEECFEIDMKDKKFFAKRFYKKSRLVNRYDEMLLGLRLGEELRKKGFPSPKIILSLKGEYLAEVGENTYQVNEWIDGLTYHPSQMPPSAARSMGEVLATFHSWTNSEYETRTLEHMSPTLILKETVDLLEQYKEFSGEFPDFAKKSLAKEIKILNSIIANPTYNSIQARYGTVFTAIWSEQLLFSKSGKVNALIDWTDGAGKQGFFIDDIATAMFISILDVDGIVEFCHGYHKVNPMSKSEWIDAIEYTAYRNLDTFVHFAWLRGDNRRMDYWLKTAFLWSEHISAN